MSDQNLPNNDPRFVQYYERESATDAAFQRAAGIMRAILRARAGLSLPTGGLRVGDIGCNAGTQSQCWLRAGHTVAGVDISSQLVDLARKRNASFGDRGAFDVASATSLPWSSESLDVALLPELLEHVEDWRTCLSEAVRVLRPGGSIYVSTTNILCPVQDEFNLPLYSWYPAPAKRHFVRLATTTSPQLVNFTSFPAVHWFNPYGLSRHLAGLGVRTLDRFDLIDVESKGLPARLLVWLIRSMPPLRLAGHVLTTNTVLLGQK